MASRWRVAAVVAMVGSGCSQIAGIREGVPIEDSQMACDTVADCAVEEPACRTAIGCEAGSCVYDDALDGTLLSEQTAGDCVELVCDGAGHVKVVPAASDAPDDGNVCTRDECVGTAPQHTPQAAVPCYSGPAGTEGKGICVAGVQQCDAIGNPVGACAGEVVSGVETCVSSLDEDCDGAANEEGEGCVCVPGTIAPCYSGPMGTMGMGACHAGAQSCNADGLKYGPCVGDQVPMAETCDAAEVDEDCDASVNEEGTDCVCGDGYLSTGEGCDDGGTGDGDNCSPVCQVQEVLDVVAGGFHTCALLSHGAVKCWGFNSYGQLGLENLDDIGDGLDEMGDNLPTVKLGTGKTAVALSAGGYHTCALLNDGSVKCWGFNHYAQLGLGDVASRGGVPEEMGDHLPAVNLGTGKTAVAVAAGYFHTCALLNDGSVKCWGYNEYGQLGLGDTVSRGDGPGEMGGNLPAVDLGKGKTAIAIVAAGAHTCALLNDGFVKCWGYNEYGQLGLGDTARRGAGPGKMGDNLPVINLGIGKLGTGNTALALAAGQHHTCALLNDGSVKCWGANGYGQLGLGDIAHRGDGPWEMGNDLSTVKLGAGKIALALALGHYHGCAFLNDGSVKCWGGNDYGQLGLGNTLHRGDGAGEMSDNLPAVNLGTGRMALALASGDGYACAYLNDSSVKCWGRNSHGQLGLGDIENRGDDLLEMGDDLASVKLFSPFW